jgi:hypothetical protein
LGDWWVVTWYVPFPSPVKPMKIPLLDLVNEKLKWGLLRTDSKMVPLVLLPFACLVFISTATCMYEMVHWDVPLKQRLNLMALYGPYTALRRF